MLRSEDALLPGECFPVVRGRLAELAQVTGSHYAEVLQLV